jgi:hypothetical protein
VDELRVPESLCEGYERTKKQFALKSHILAILECPADLFKLPEQEQLKACGLTGCTVLQYAHDAYDAVKPENERIGGRMVPVEKNGRRYAVILIRNDYEPDRSDAQVIMTKFCILYHELGHAEDLYQGINFDHKNKQCTIRQAEAYADDFAVRHLKRVKCEKIVAGKAHETTLGDWYRENRYRGLYVM